MTVTERLMKPGQWRLKLRPDTPLTVLDAPDWFDLIVVTPSRVLPLTAYGDSTLLGQALYSGVLVDRPSLYELAGEGLGYLLGTEMGAGEIAVSTPVSNTNGTLDDWMSDLFPVNGLTKGTVTNTGTTLTWGSQYMTRREALDWVAKNVGAEYRINANLTVDAAAPATLFGNPTVVITRKPEGPEGSYVGIEATETVRNSTIRGYATRIAVIGDALALGDANASNQYRDPGNNYIVMERLVNAPDLASGALAGYAANVLATAVAKVGFELSSRSYAISRHVQPGDYVYVYDLLAGVYDPANQIMWRGELINPLKIRVQSITWPLTDGMGVYCRHGNGSTFDWTDLTDFVQWEDGGETVWEVGTSPVDPTLDPEQQTAAYLGQNAAILDRANA